MKDTVLNGTGNSRYLKSVENFKALYPTYDDFAAALVAGTLPIDLNGINAAGVSQVGTALNKANLLTDETAALYGKNGSATVNDILAAVRPIALGGTGATTAAGAMSNLTNGILTMAYTELHDADQFVFRDASASAAKKITVGNLMDWLTKSNGMPRTKSGSYVGTGTYGESNPCTIDLSMSMGGYTYRLRPKLVLLLGYYSASSNDYTPLFGTEYSTSINCFAVSGETLGSGWNNAQGFYNGSMYSYAKWESGLLSWYNTNSAGSQCNVSGRTYFWYALF